MGIASEIWRAVGARWGGKRLARWAQVALLSTLIGLFATRSASADGDDDVLVPEGEPASILDGLAWTSMGAVNAIAYSPDGKLLAVGSSDTQVHLWDVASGHEIRLFNGHTGAVNAVAFSPDGKLLASGSADNTVRLWDLTSGRSAQRFEGHAYPVNAVAFSPDGKLLASGSQDQTIHLWDLSSAREIRRLEGHSSSVTSAVFSPDGKLLASGSRDKTVRLWDVASGRETQRIVGHSDAISSVAFSPDGKRIASSSQDQTTRLWDLASGAEVTRFSRDSYSVSSVAFSPDGKLLVSGCQDKTIRLWDLASGREVRRVEGHSGSVNVVAFSPNGKTLASGSTDRSVRLWDLASTHEIRRFMAASEPARAAAVSPHDRLLAGAAGPTVNMWDIASGRELQPLKDDAGWLADFIAFNTAGDALASSGGEAVLFRDLAGGQQIQRFKTRAAAPNPLFPGSLTDLRLGKQSIGVPSQSPRSSSLVPSSSPFGSLPDGWLNLFLAGHATSPPIAFSLDGKTLASGSYFDAVLLWDTASGHEIRRLVAPEDPFQPRPDAAFPLSSHHQWFPSLAFSPDGKIVAAGTDNKAVILWDAATGREIRRLAGHDKPFVGAIAFSPDGKLLASGADDETVRLWSVSSGREVQRFEGHTDRITSVAFSPDGKLVASGSRDRTARLWSVPSGREVQRFEGHTDAVTSVAFTADSRLISASADGAIRLWPAGKSPSPPLLFAHAPHGWISASSEGRVHRHDDGSFLHRARPDGALEPIPPAAPDRAPDLRLSAHVVASPGDGPDRDGPKAPGLASLTLTVANAATAGRAYWIRVEAIDPPPGFLILPPPTQLRLDPGQTANIPVGLSWVSPDDPPVPHPKTTLRLKVVHAHGESAPLEVPLDLRAPVLELDRKPSVEAGAVRLTLVNKGDQSTGPLQIRAFFEVDGKDEPSDADQTLDGLAPLGHADLALPVPLNARKAGRFSLRLVAATDLSASWIRFPSRTWTLHQKDLRTGLPFFVTIVTVVTAILLLAAIVYLRIYRHPFVVRVAASPGALALFPLPDLPAVHRALRRARHLDASLAVAGVAPERWQRALRAAEPGAARLDAFAEALGAILGAPISDAPPGATAREISLPSLRLRFAEQTAIALVEGRDLEPGAAARLASAIHRGGAGPRQALVLDLTTTQQARARLRDVPSVAFVVLSEGRLRDLLLADKPAEVFEATLVEQVKIAELSPYQTAGGVEQEALFFGRERELRTIADRKLRNFLLVGPRQMGKSTLLKALERRLRGRVDAEVHYVTLADADVTAHLSHHLDRGADPGPSSVDAFRAVAAGAVDKPRLWLLDEADRFVADDAARDHAITRAMRSLAQDGLAYFVLAGYWHLYAAAALDRDHPLLNFAELLRLGPLDPDAARALAVEPAAALGLRWDDASTVDHLIEGAGRRANLIVLACKAMIESLGPEDRSLTRAALDRAIARQDTDLADALRALRAYDLLDRILVGQSFLLGEPTPDALRAAIRARGITAPSAELDRAFDRLRLGYMLVPGEDGRLACPVPFIREAILRAGTLEDRLRDDVADFMLV